MFFSNVCKMVRFFIILYNQTVRIIFILLFMSHLVCSKIKDNPSLTETFSKLLLLCTRLQYKISIKVLFKFISEVLDKTKRTRLLSNCLPDVDFRKCKQ